MTIRVLGPGSGGTVYCVHNSGFMGGEHFFVTKVRRDSRATYLTDACCDAVTTIPRSDANADHREVQALIDAGKVTPVLLPDPTPLALTQIDPLAAAREDGVGGIPAVIPQTTQARIALRSALKAAHRDVRPAGTRFQKRIGNVIEVHEDNGAGVTTVKERYDVDADGRLRKR